MLYDDGSMTRHKYFFFFKDTATTEISTLPQHDALPISRERSRLVTERGQHTSRIKGLLMTRGIRDFEPTRSDWQVHLRSEEHTSELQSRQYLVCRLLLEKKKKSIL